MNCVFFYCHIVERKYHVKCNDWDKNIKNIFPINISEAYLFLGHDASLNVKCNSYELDNNHKLGLYGITINYTE